MTRHSIYEIFSGTGGVGKTTIASARAISLAEKGYKVLLITIDPSKRLKEVLKLNSEESGNISTQSISNIIETESDNTLDCLLMNPQKTITRITSINLSTDRIMSILSSPYGGLNEILALIELNHQRKKNTYDKIILDTPPGAHFLDFLYGVEKIKTFFDQSFIEVFNAIINKKNKSSSSFSRSIVNKFISGSVKKLLGLLESVTGADFINEFLKSIDGLYSSKDDFLDALNIQSDFKNKEITSWYFVTSIEQSKVKELISIQKHSGKLINENCYLVLNKCLKDQLQDWDPKVEKYINIKKSIVNKELNMIDELKTCFKSILTFEDIISSSPQSHVNALTKKWSNYGTV